jgi:hypothetical protein
MVSEAMLDHARQLQESLMPNRCTILVAAPTEDSPTGTARKGYTPASYSEPASTPCRVQPGTGREYTRLDVVIADMETWTVTVPAGIEVKQADRIAIKDHTPAILDVEYISNGGSFETAIVLICTKAS